MLEYSGSDVVQEKIYVSKPIQKDLIVEVLSVGDIHPPQVHNTPVCSGNLSQGIISSLTSEDGLFTIAPLCV